MKKLLTLLAASALFSAGLPAKAADTKNEFKVVVIDAKSATVTARDNKTSNTFTFKVNDQRMLQAIKVGDAGQADFKTGKVTVQPKGTIPPIAGVILVSVGSVPAAGGETVRQRSAAPTAVKPDLTGVGVPLPDLVPLMEYSPPIIKSYTTDNPCTAPWTYTSWRYLRVKNATGVAAGGPIGVKLFRNGTQVATWSVPAPAANSVVTAGKFSAQITVPCPTPGTSTTSAPPQPNHRFVIDIGNAVAERNENNNSLEFYMSPAFTFSMGP